MSVNQDTLKQIVEAAIMAAEAPLTVPQILGLFPEEARPERERVNEVLESLEADSAERGIELRKVGGGYRYQTREHLAPWLRKLNEGRPPRYSRAMLETLAIVAYRQPVTRGDIEDIRGVAVSTEIMRTLSEREWIKQVGVRDVPGHPALYGTTPAFLAYFNLQSLKELPALIEQRDLRAIAREQNIDLPMDENADTHDEGTGDDEDGDDTLAARADTAGAPESEAQVEAPDDEVGLLDPKAREAGDPADTREDDRPAEPGGGETLDDSDPDDVPPTKGATSAGVEHGESTSSDHADTVESDEAQSGDDEGERNSPAGS